MNESVCLLTGQIQCHFFKKTHLLSSTVGQKSKNIVVAHPPHPPIFCRHFLKTLSLTLSNGENCICMRQIHLFEKEVTSELCWKKRLRTFVDHLADYLDLTFIIDSGGKLSTRLYDKRDDFDFHIVNFPFLSSNIPSGPSYGVYISQLIRYARCCSHYDDFRYRHKCLVDRLLLQGYKALRLEKSFKKFYGRYQDLIEKYRRSVNAMVSDSFPGQFLFNM